MYFRKESLEKIFICFPDPHFKNKNKRKRIVNFGFLSEFTYCMKQGARLYCITDVKELHEWHLDKLQKMEGILRVLPEEELKDDVCV